MKRFALLTALAATLAAPAVADTAFAIQHFNQDADSIGDIRMVPEADTGVTVSTSGISPFAVAFDVLNESQDSVADLRGLNGATVLSNTHSAEAADIFARLRAESLEDE